MVIKEGVNSGNNSFSRNNNFSSNENKNIVGKVYGVITTENTPTKKQFENFGGYSAIGTIFYIEYNSSKNIKEENLQSDDFFDTKCTPAIPLNSNILDYPLIGELVQITSVPSEDSQSTQISTIANYYGNIINLYNNPQHNSQTTNPNASLGDSFIENGDIRNLISFQGDRIYQGRKGNGIRFGSTAKKYSDINEWSSIGKDGDPITIMINGYITTNKNPSIPNVEEINKELSSIYMTSTQLIPLLPDRNDIVNPFTKPILPNKYIFPQIILNSDRVIINSKKDEVMIYAKTNIELNTNNIINLNANNRVHLNSGTILLGTNPTINDRFEPVLLGLSTIDFLLNMITELSTFTSKLQAATSTPQGSPITGINSAAASFGPKLTSMMDKLENLLSKQTFTS
jgi:hypothetical protein